MIQIQRILIKPSFREQFFMKVDDNKAEKITKTKYDKLYDNSWETESLIKVLPPITKELR